MTPHYSDPLVTLWLGDCLEVMPALEADSVDAIVTDPPAGIAFMSKHWDRDKGGRTEWVAWMTEVMRECYRVLKPGGYALVWSIPRTCHWTAWAMEDAGFVIRDQLAHVFASGFPKGKAQLKPAREDWWLARKPGPMQPLGIDACRIEADWETDPTRRGWQGGNSKSVGPTGNFGMTGDRVAQADPAGRWPSNLLLSDPELFDEPNPWVVGSGAVTTTPGSYDYGTPDTGNPRIYGNGAGIPKQVRREAIGDSGGYSRFFIVPKAPKQERMVNGQRGTHPTQKPVDLMRHLLKLVTPLGGVALDPFAGSGTTGVAASLEGIRSILIEREAEYVEQAVGRLMATPMGLGLNAEVVQPTRKKVGAASGYVQGKRHPGNWPWLDHGPNDEEPAA